MSEQSSSMKPDTSTKDPAFAVVAMDILSNVLSRADSPGDLGTYLTEEIRDLTGARCVLLVQYLNTPTVTAHRVVSVNPLRRREWAESPAVNRLYEVIRRVPAAQFWRGEEPLEVAGLLRQAGFELSLVFPLHAGGFCVGAMLVLGLPDEEHISSVLSLLNDLSTIVALVLRNAFLFERQEQVIQERTEEWQTANEQLQIELAERKRAEETLQRLNRELRAITDCNQLLLRATDEQTLLNDICRIVCDEAGYRMAWVGYAEHDEAKTVRPVAWAGVEDSYLAAANITWADVERGRGPTGIAIRGGQSSAVQDFTTDPQVAPWRESALQRGYRSSIALPLKDENADIFGALNIYSTEPDAFTSDEMRLLERLAGDLAFGITVLRARAERRRVEQGLRESEEKFAAAFHASPSLMAITRITDGTILEVNEGYSQLLGYSRAESIGRTTANLAIWANLADRATFVANLERFGQVTNFETTLRRKDGRLITVIDSARTIQLQGETCILSVVYDITDRKRAEQASKEQYSTLRGIIDSADALIFSVDRQYRYTSFNRGHAAVMKAIYGAEIQIGHSLLDYMTVTEDRATAQRNLDRALAGERLVEEAYSGEELRSRRYFRVSHSPIKTEEGAVIGVAVLAQDITERKQAEEALRESELRYREVFENSSECIFLLDVTEDGCFKFAEFNPAEEKAVGYSNAAVAGKLIEEAVPKELAEQVVANYRRCVEEETSINYDEELDLPVGRRYFHTVLIPVRNAGGDIYRIVGVARDVTEQKRAEEETVGADITYKASPAPIL